MTKTEFEHIIQRTCIVLTSEAQEKIFTLNDTWRSVANSVLELYGYRLQFLLRHFGRILLTAGEVELDLTAI